MKKVAVTAAALTFIVGLLMGMPEADATPADGAWEFTGSMTAPARSESNVDITVSGTIQVTAGLLASVASTKSCDDTHPPQVIPYVQNTSSGAFTAISNGGLQPTPISAAGSSSVSGTANVAPGSYKMVLRFRCTGAGSWDGNVAATPAVTVSIANVASTTYTTRACIATTPVTACTSIYPQAASVPTGTAVTFAGLIRRVWSDGAVTETPVDGSQTLKQADVGSGYWSTIGSTCAYTTNVTTTQQYRCESTYGTHDPVTVTVMTATSEYLIGTPTPNPSIAVKGTSIAVSGILQQRYPDGSFWPAPTNTAYTLQFQAAGTSAWTTAATGTLRIAGNYSATFTLTGTGKIRVSVGSQHSAEVPVTELAATSEYEVSTLSAPSSVAPATSVSMSATVRSKWSDGEWRSAPNGTPAVLEFAPGFDSASTPTGWRTAQQGTVQSGTASFTTVPQGSGFWRITVSTYSSAAAYVSVSGSSPLSLSATMTPASGQTPFEGTESAYDITAQLGGYVGTEAVSLFVDLGTGSFTKVGTLTGGAFSGRARVEAPAKGGSYTPRFEVRNRAGDVLATATGSPIVVDGVASYAITARATEDPVREGLNGKVFGTLAAVTNSGRRLDVPWSGTAQLQRSLGGDWATIDSLRASGSSIAFTTPAVAAASYRISWVGQGVTSNVVRLQVLTPTGKARFGAVTSDERRIVKGDSVRLTAVLQEEYSDQSYYPAAAGREVLLQVFTGSTWKTSKKLYTQGGSVTVSVRPGSTTQYRFVQATAGTSKTLTVEVVEPQPRRLDVDWPDSYDMYEGASFTVAIKTTTGSIWTGTTTLYLQYRFNSYESWRTLDTRTYKGKRMNWGWGSGTYSTVYFKVSAPSLGMSDTIGYS